MDDRIGANRCMWILERKFKDWNLRWNPMVEEHEAENPDEEIVEDATEYQYPTLIGPYLDVDNTERPKDIMPVHHAVFNKYVIPNPDYDGDEDDNTREIAKMWALRIKMDEESAYEFEHREERLRLAAIAREQARQEQEREALNQPANNPIAPINTTQIDDTDKLFIAKEEARERLLAKIRAQKNRSGFHEEANDEDDVSLWE